MFWRSLPNDDGKFSYLRFWRQRELAAVNFPSLPLHENHSWQASERALRLFCTTWSTWNNRKRLNLTQSSVLMRRCPCSCRRSFLSSLLKLPMCCRVGGQVQHEKLDLKRVYKLRVKFLSQKHNEADFWSSKPQLRSLFTMVILRLSLFHALVV